MAALRDQLRERLAHVEERIGAACRRAGRPRHEVGLVAVTKTVSVEVVGLLHELGVTDLGESRPQELWRKAEALPKTIRWHQIGHLQTNKVDRTLPLVHMIHSVDSVKLLHAIEKEAEKQDRTVAVLLEVNASGETAKHGFSTEGVEDAMAEIGNLRKVHVRGLMTMAAFDKDPARCRPTFALLRDLRERLLNRVAAPHGLGHLSMGMSNDFEVAIEEGATLIRLGTVLFDGLVEGPA